MRDTDRPVDPARIDWNRVDMGVITFVQAPGRDNALGKVKFLSNRGSARRLRSAGSRGRRAPINAQMRPGVAASGR